MRSSEERLFWKLLRLLVIISMVSLLLFFTSHCKAPSKCTYKVKRYWEITPVYQDQEIYYAKITHEKKEKKETKELSTE